MTLSRNAVHDAMKERLEAVAGMPVRVGVSSVLPYVRIGQDEEGPTAENKDGAASLVDTMVSVFSVDFGEARQTVKSIADTLVGPDAAPLVVGGFRVMAVRLTNVIPVPEYDTERTVFGERLLFEITTEPMAA